MAYNKYRAARDTIEQFTKEPPFAYEIPREQRDSPTAALLLEKLMLKGIEVHQSVKPDAWVVMMDQPFAGLVKELFEPQVYPALSQRPYDVTGWTLPMQMGVEVHPVTTPLSKQFAIRCGRSKKSPASPRRSNCTANASYQRREPDSGRQRHGLVRRRSNHHGESGRFQAQLHPRPQTVCKVAAAERRRKAVKPARIGLYRPWVASIDEGWTRWILEQYQFPFTSLYNADIRGGHLREHYDTIVLPDVSEAPDYRTATAPERFPNATRAASARRASQELRDFVDDGGTLVTFNNASMFAINQFKLPVENAIAGANAGPFFCSGCLLDRSH